jgi:hypothetical protein
LAATVLESLLPLLTSEKGEVLETEKLVSICRGLELEQLGILVLETLASNRKNALEDEDGEQPRKRPRIEGGGPASKKKLAKSEILALIDLYKSMGDLESARELYLQEMASQVRFC